MNRRDALTALGALATLTAAAAAGSDGGVPAPAAARPPGAPPPGPAPAPGRPEARAPGAHVVKPLPFDPARLPGLSERLLRSHHENNYGGAVKNLNKVEEQLARVGKDTPAFVLGGLKERELLFTNSLVLHELYFGNLGGDGKPGGAVQRALAERYGSFGRWEEHLRATGMSLAGGSGWAVLDFNLHTGDLSTHWSGNHTQAPATGLPLLVMDMYEHAYALDYGAGAAKYVDAFFRNVNWEVVERRYAQARAAHAALKA
jgi:Fe-Mn family superoxide dismutase